MDENLSQVIVVDNPRMTMVGDIPFSQQGFHWQFETDNEVRAKLMFERNVRGYCGDREIGRGVVTKVQPVTNDNLKCFVTPPKYEFDTKSIMEE